jgi:hypothetical protein
MLSFAKNSKKNSTYRKTKLISSTYTQLHGKKNNTLSSMQIFVGFALFTLFFSFPFCILFIFPFLRIIPTKQEQKNQQAKVKKNFMHV